MDCMMPELDGFLATDQIRRFEAAEGVPRTPIVAVTASALAEDRAACLAAGMDDHLAKPFSERDLIDRLGRWCPARADAEPARPPAPQALANGPAVPMAAQEEAGLDLAHVAAMRAARPALLARLIGTYLEHMPQTLAALSGALASGSAAALAAAAHSMRSASANVGAARIAMLARQIEALAAADDVTAAVAIADDLRAAYANTSAALEATRRDLAIRLN
jgi:CheY-like chemotaxis protein